MAGSHDDHGHGFSSLDLRILAIFVVMVSAMLGTIVPTLILKAAGAGSEAARTKAADLLLKKILRILTALSIGIILGTAMLHLIPEAAEKLTEEWGDDAHDSHAATPAAASTPAVAAPGVTTAAPHDDHDDHNTTVVNGTTAAPHDDHNDHNTTVVNGTTAAPHDDHDDHADGDHDDHDDHGDEHAEEGHAHAFPYAFIIALGAALILYAIERELHAAVARSRAASKARMAEEAKNAPKGTDSQSSEEDLKAVGAVAVPVPVAKQQAAAEEEELERAREMAMASHVVDISLSIHSSILGLAIGLLTGYDNIRVLLIAAAFDQFADGVALGSTLSESRLLSMPQAIVLRIIFGLSCAMGVAIGIAIDQSGSSANKAVQGVLASISGGMLLVIALTNMLPVLTKPFASQAECCVHENHDDAAAAHNEDGGTHGGDDDEAHQPLTTLWRLGLYLCVAVGLAAMAVIANWG
jgi:zinc transporter ZupT